MSAHTLHPFLAPLTPAARYEVREALLEVLRGCPLATSRVALEGLTALMSRRVLTADSATGVQPVQAYDQIRRRLSHCAATGDGAALSWVSEVMAYEALSDAEKQRLCDEAAERWKQQHAESWKRYRASLDGRRT